MKSPPRLILGLCFLLSLVTLLSALAGMAVTLMQSPPLWFLFGFELCVALASVFGVLVGLGKIREGPALAMLIVGGTMAVGAVLGEPAVAVRLLGRTGAPITISGVQILPFAMARLGMGVVMMGLAAVTILIRQPGRSFGYLIRAAILGVPVIGALVVVAVPAWRAALMSLSPLMGFFTVIAGFFVLGGFLAASLHCLIRAFEVGQVDRLTPPTGA